MERMFLMAEAKRVALRAVRPGWEEMTTFVVFLARTQTGGRLAAFNVRAPNDGLVSVLSALSAGKLDFAYGLHCGQRPGSAF